MAQITNMIRLMIIAALTANAGACYAGTRNVILMISDGQGLGTVMAADFYNGKKAVYEGFPEKYLMTTFKSGGSYIPDRAWKDFDANMDDKDNTTDSAAAATAMATGVKTVSGFLGKAPDKSDVKNIVEKASEAGMATGIVTSVPFSHATPAGMVVHNASRGDYDEIARYMIYNTELDVIMGAGHPCYDKNSLKKESGSEYRYVGGEEAFKDMTDADGARAKDGKIWKYIESVDDFEKVASGKEKPEKLLGLARVETTLQQAREGDVQKVDFSGQNRNVPSLSTMSRAALNSLSTDRDGFFLMIEGGAVDWANHSNQKGRVIEEQTAFNAAVEAVVEWIEKNSSWNETLLVVTADHDTGYIWGTESDDFVPVKDKGRCNIPEMFYHSKDHTNMPVLLYAKGNGAERFRKMIDGRDMFMGRILSSFDYGFTGDYIDNTDVYAVMVEAVGGKQGK